MNDFINQIKRIQTLWTNGFKIQLTVHFCIIIQHSAIYLIYKPHKESTVRIGNIKF